MSNKEIAQQLDNEYREAIAKMNRAKTLKAEETQLRKIEQIVKRAEQAGVLEEYLSFQK